jgi:hypothetical protein
MAQVQEHLMQISQLSRAVAEALANGNENFAAELDRQVDVELGKKERAMGGPTSTPKRARLLKCRTGSGCDPSFVRAGDILAARDNGALDVFAPLALISNTFTGIRHNCSDHGPLEAEGDH